MSEENRPLGTSCRDCALAVYDGSQQVDCELNRLDAFEAEGAEIVGLDDGERQYLTLSRFCNTYVTYDAIETRKLDRHNLAEAVRKSVEVRIGYVVVTTPITTTEQLDTTLSSITDQEILPARAVITTPADVGLTPATIIASVRASGLFAEWDVVQTCGWKDVASSYTGRRDLYDIDEGVRVLKPAVVTYYSALEAGHPWPLNFSRRIDRAINDHMIPLVAVTPHEEGPYLMQVAFHNHALVVGNIGGHVLDKLPLILADYPTLRVVSYEDLSCV